MDDNRNSLPQTREIEALRQKIKSKHHETAEECDRLLNEIKKLSLDLQRVNRPGRRAGKRSSKSILRQPVSPEVIPPDLDVNEYLAQKSNSELLAPDVSCPVITGKNYSAGCSNIVEQREKTIEERFALVARRMQERKQRWQAQQQKRPWWKPWPGKEK